MPFRGNCFFESVSYLNFAFIFVFIVYPSQSILELLVHTGCMIQRYGLHTHTQKKYVAILQMKVQAVAFV